MAGIEDFTDEYFQRTRAELAKPFPSTVAPIKVQDSSFAQNVWDEITVQPFWNMLSQTNDTFQPYDPNFEPLSKDNIKGYEQYAGVLREARNEAHNMAIKSRIDRFRETKERIDEEGGLLSGFVSELFNPINYLLPGSSLVRGVGLVRGFARGVAAGAPSQLVDEALRQRVDPTATLMESGSNLAYGLVFTGLLGSGVGFMKAPDIDGIAKRYQQDMDRFMGNKETPEAPAMKTGIEPEPTIRTADEVAGKAAGATVAEPAKTVTAPEQPAPTGIYRLPEALSGIVRINAYGDLITSAVSKWESFGHTVLGEGDIILNKNLAGLPTETSLYLGNSAYTGPAIDYRKNLESLFGEYLGGGLEQLEIGGLNIPVTARRMADVVRGKVGSRASDGLMTYPEFQDMIYRSLRDNAPIEVPANRLDGTPLTDREKQIVARGAEMTAGLYKELGRLATEAGYLPTKQNTIRKLDLHQTALREHQDKLADLYSIQNPTANNLVEIAIREEAIVKIGEKITELNTYGVRDEGFYQQRIKDIAIAKKAKQTKAADTLETLREDLANRRLEMEAELNDLLAKDADKVTSRDLRRMDYLEKRLAEGTTKKQQAFIDRLNKTAGGQVEKREILTEEQIRNRAWTSVSAYITVSLEEMRRLKNMLRADPTNQRLIDQIAKFEELEKPGAFERLVEEFTQTRLKEQENPTVFPSTTPGKINGYTKRQAEYLYYLMEKQEELAQIRKDIEDGTIDFGNLRENYTTIIYNLDTIMADEAGQQIFRKKIYNKFNDDSRNNNYKGERSDLSYELGIDEAAAFVDKNDVKAVLAKIQELEANKRAVREALTPEELQPIIEKQRKVRDAISGRMAEVEAKLTPEEIAAAPRATMDIEVLKTRLAYLMGEIKVNGLSADKQAEEFQRLINERVNQTMNNILRQGELGELSVGRAAGTSFMAKRKLGFSPHEIADFTITDLNALSIAYSQRVGMASQLTKAFGDRDALLGIYRSLADGVSELKGNDPDKLMEKVNKAKNSMLDVRDYALGDQWAKDVTAWDRKAVRAVLDWSTTTGLSNSLIGSLSDSIRPLTTFGIQRNLEFALKGLWSDLETMKKMTAEVRRLTGEFGEVAMASVAHSYVQGGGVVSAGTNAISRAADKFSGFANGAFFYLNGLQMYTEGLKRWTGLMSAHYLIEDAIKIANKTADEKTQLDWRALMLRDEDATAIAKLVEDGVIERPNFGYLANTANWSDPELVNRYRVAVRSQIRRAIVTSGPANKPTIAQGFVGQGEDRREVALARIPFQFMSWGFAANNKIMLSALQGRDANVFGTVLGLVGMGAIVSYLNTPASIWEKLTLEEKILRSTERSGIFGIFTDTSSIVEQATRGHYGIRPMLGMDPPYGEVDAYRQFNRIAGAPTTNFTNLYKVFVDQDLTDRERAKAVINMIPLTGAFYWKEGWQQLGRSAADAWD